MISSISSWTVGSLSFVSTGPVMKGSKSADKADKLKTVSAYLEGRMHKVSDSLAKLDATEKKGEAELKAVTEKQMPVQDSTHLSCWLSRPKNGSEIYSIQMQVTYNANILCGA